ncbi:hypothetical protein [Cronobacter phage vB_Cdu_VP8]|nr:hypothetical protein [Cronobacter phage vB_Cdu_VP8]
MNLKIILPQKKINLNQREILIPKLGLKHHVLIKEVREAHENLQILMDSICPGLNKAETEIVMLHTLEFNGRIPLTKDGLSLSDITIETKTKFEFQGRVYKFRAPTFYEKFKTHREVLETLFESVDGDPTMPDFGMMPAFVGKWAKSLQETIRLGNLVGINEIMDHYE